MRDEIGRAGRAAVVFASAVSQDAFLAALRAQEIDWTRITAFHMDEYAGMSGDHPASFRRFLRERLFDHVPVAAFHQLDGEAADAAAECERYAGLLHAAEPCLVIMGIGENGHLAFIDPPVCDFERSAGRAAGGTRRCLPHAAGTRWSVRAAGGCAAARALADRAVLPAGAAGAGVRQWRAQERGGARGAGRADRGSVSGVGAAAASFGDPVSGPGAASLL